MGFRKKGTYNRFLESYGDKGREWSQWVVILNDDTEYWNTEIFPQE